MKKTLSRLDVLFFLVCTLVGLDTLGSVAARGAQGFLWLGFLAITFFVPYALLVAELGSAFPQEGGPYLWTRDALGKPLAAVVSVFYWFSNPIWLGGALTISAIATWNTFFFELGEIGKYVFGLALIWLCVGGAVLSLGIGKWVTTFGAWARVLLLGFFTVSVALYGMKHGVHGVAITGFRPTYSGFIGVVPLLFFNFVGFELPSAAGGEMVDPKRDVPFAVVRCAFISVLCYGVPILAILLVVPAEHITGLRGFVDAMQTVFTVYGRASKVLGGTAALGFVFALLTSGTTWIMGADRVQAVACADGAGPRFLGSFSAKHGTPVPLNIASGVVSTVVMFAAFAVTGGSAEKFFAASLNLGISTTSIAYVGIFPALWLLRKQQPNVDRPYRVPAARLATVLTTGWALFASICLVWPGFGMFESADTALPTGFEGQRLLFELTQVVPLVLLLALGGAFIVIGRKRTEFSRMRTVMRVSIPVTLGLALLVARPRAAQAQTDPEQPTTTEEKAPIGVNVGLSTSLVLRGGTSQETLMQILSGSYALNSWLSTYGRVGWVHDASADGSSGNGFANPAAGLTASVPVGKHLTLGGIVGVTVPVGSGGGNAPNKAVLKAWTNSIDWGGAMFAVDHVDTLVGGKGALAFGDLTLSLESTLHELTRVKGEAADPIGAHASVTSTMATVSFALHPKLTLSSALSETRFWNRPTCIRETPASAQDYFFIVGASTDFKVRGVDVAPGLVYARALDLPLSADKFQVVELDLAFSL